MGVVNEVADQVVEASVEALLQQWAEWVRVGDGSGYPRTSMLHPEWSPPASGQRPSMKVGAASRGPEINALVRRLSGRLQATLVMHYCYPGLSRAAQVARLDVLGFGCSVATLGVRVAQARRLIGVMLEDAKSRQI
mgnify:CR=1 FL=1